MAELIGWKWNTAIGLVFNLIGVLVLAYEGLKRPGWLRSLRKQDKKDGINTQIGTGVAERFAESRKARVGVALICFGLMLQLGGSWPFETVTPAQNSSSETLSGTGWLNGFMGTIANFARANLRDLFVQSFGVFVGAFLAFLTANWIYRRGQKEQFRGLVNALMMETADNQSHLRNAIEKEQWATHRIDSYRPRSTAADAIVTDSGTWGHSKHLPYAISVYRAAIQSVERTMEMWEGVFVTRGGLEKKQIETIDRVCHNALAATYLLQEVVEEECGAMRVAKSTERSFAERLAEKRERIRDEIVRPAP